MESNGILLVNVLKGHDKPYPKSFNAKWHLSIYARNNTLKEEKNTTFVYETYSIWILSTIEFLNLVSSK